MQRTGTKPKDLSKKSRKILGPKPKVLSKLKKNIHPGSKVLLKCKNWKTLVVTGMQRMVHQRVLVLLLLTWIIIQEGVKLSSGAMWTFSATFQVFGWFSLRILAIPKF